MDCTRAASGMLTGIILAKFLPASVGGEIETAEKDQKVMFPQFLWPPVSYDEAWLVVTMFR